MQDTDAALDARPASAPSGAQASPAAAPPAIPSTPRPTAPPPSGRSLRAQLTWSFGTLAVLLVLGLSLAFGELLRARMERDAQRALQAVSETAAASLANTLFEYSRVAQVIADAPDLWRPSMGGSDSTQLFTRLQRSRPLSTWVGITDAQGRLIHSSTPSLQGTSVAEQPWFIHGIGTPYVSDVVASDMLTPVLPANANGEPLRFVDFAAPIQANGQLQGVFVIRTNWDLARESLQALLPTFAKAQQIQLFVFDRNGALIYAPDGKLAPYQSIDQRLPLQAKQLQTDRRAAALHADVITWKDQTAPFLTTVSALPARNAPSNLGWLVVARQPEATAYAQARNLTLSVMGAGLLAAIVATALVWWLSQRVGRELNALALAARRIDGGERNVPIPPMRSNREVQQLSDSMRSMTQHLIAAHDSMQHEVQQRTQELYDANRELDRQASTDPLTGLLNRRGFDLQIPLVMSLARRSGRPLCLMTLDIDHFQKINDSFGYEVGDLVIKSVANQMRSRLRDSDIIARFGGEEFVLLLPDTAADAAQDIARELLAGIARHKWPLVGQLTLSAGITALRPTLQNGTEDNEAALLRRSEEALYQSKSLGLSYVSFTP